MSTTVRYETILATIPESLARDIFHVMLDYVGVENPILIDDLARRVLGKATSTTIRQTREALETLRRDHHIPVISQSGKAGRYLAATEEEKDNFVVEMQARANSLLAEIDSMKKAQIPVVSPFDLPVAQLSLFGGAA